MTDYTPTTLVVKHAVTYERERLGEPRPIKPEAFDRWLEQVKAEAKADALVEAVQTYDQEVGYDLLKGYPEDFMMGLRYGLRCVKGRLSRMAMGLSTDRTRVKERDA